MNPCKCGHDRGWHWHRVSETDPHGVEAQECGFTGCGCKRFDPEQTVIPETTDKQPEQLTLEGTYGSIDIG
jgi:hypothetical protein